MRLTSRLRTPRAAPALALLLIAAATLCGVARAHDDSPASLERAAERSGWDGVSRALAGAGEALERDDLAGARALLAAAASANPGDARITAFAARLALAEGRASAAESLASSALARAPHAGFARLVRARARVALGDAAGALADFDRVIAASAGHDEDLVVERARAAHALLGAGPALAALEARTGAGPWTPARRDLASRFERELGREPAPRVTSPASPRPAVAPGPAPAGAFRAAAAADTLVARGSAWRWYAGPSAPPGPWTDLAYADNAWPAGPAPLGYGEPRVATTLPFGGDPANRWVTSYARIHFVRPAGGTPALVARLEADYDDGFVAYLNGVEIARRGLGSGVVTWGTYAASRESGVYESIVLADPALLQEGDNVLAVELHQSSAGSADLLWDAALLSDSDAAARTRGPYLQNATPNAITVRWRTVGPVVGRVSLGPAGGTYTQVFDEPVARTEHEVRLTGLAPETGYAYSAHDAAGAPEPVGDARTFRTPPPAGAARPVRIWAIGDSGLDSPGQRQVRDAYLAWAGARREDLWLLLGDNAYTTGTDAEYQAGLFDAYPLTLSRSPLWSTRGNHDYVHAGVDNDYYDLFTLPAAGEAGGVPSGTEAWYSFDWGPVHFVCLDSEGSDRSPGGAMLQWLRADLAATPQPWVIAYWHHPPYTKGSHDSDDPADSGGRMRDMRERVLPVLDSLGVDLVLGGHSHSYERSYLLDGHYGLSGSLTAAMKLDPGDGRPGGDGAYQKAGGTPRAHEGAVYAVNGSAAQASGGTLDHPAMVASLNVMGSMVVDIDGGRLDARFLDGTGAVRDSFAIVKPLLVSAPAAAGAPRSSLAAARPTPFTDRTELSFTLARPGRASLAVYDVGGRRVRTLADRSFAAGAHRATWDGRDDRGARVEAGVYLVLLDAAGERSARRVVRIP